MDGFKVGDIVRIAKREGCAADYPVLYVDEMCKYEGRLVKIASLHELNIGGRQTKKYNNDCYYYQIKDLDGNDIAFNWHSSMFEPVTVEEQKSQYQVGDIVQIIQRNGCEEQYPMLYTDSMCSYKGKLAKIESIHKMPKKQCERPKYNGDPYYYLLVDLENHYLNFEWHSSMFQLIKKVITTETIPPKGSTPSKPTLQIQKNRSIKLKFTI